MANFQSLPLDIRQEIYLLATPARVVQLKVGVPGCKDSHPHLLSCNPDWLRGVCPPKQYFYSNAPVPALLHTSRESREWLAKKGYQLAFKTQSQGPRTWFNYDRDVLLVDQVSCNPKQLDADEAAKVRRLAVDYITDCFYDSIGYDWRPRLHSGGDACLYSFIEDFPALEEVLVVDWKRNTFPMELTRNTSYPVKPPSMRHRYDTENLWKCVKVEDSFLLRTMHQHDAGPYTGPKIVEAPLGYYGPAPNIADWGTFGHRSSYLQSELAACRRSHIRSGQKRSVGDWRAPKIITPVHLVDERQEKILQQKQKIAVYELRRLREYWAPVLKERKARIDARSGVISAREIHYLWTNRWEMTCWIEKDIFSSSESKD
ncbi:hypothetical protein FPCIR_2593 [Fusarium pseudocircinatum]|uniref:2EXR domain-containing protein n=1 Tax=Fusarium pseudocircinatum TaxID=56676 RepID=A0A8H5PLF5_9HYPO|nr:hypothetical protein FPCIR_2593 [Fusarium pseudocircinatum]